MVNKKQPGKRGRPRAFKDAVTRATYLEVLEVGGSRTAAAAIVGITEVTVRAEEKRNAEFAKSIVAAKEVGKARNLLRIYRAGIEDWKAGAWLLERMFNSEFGKQERHEHSGPNGTAIPLTVVQDDGWYGNKAHELPTQQQITETNTTEFFENGHCDSRSGTARDNQGESNGNAHSLPPTTAFPSIAGPTEPGEVQGGDVRPEVGQNGSRTNGHAAGAWPESGDDERGN